MPTEDNPADMTTGAILHNMVEWSILAKDKWPKWNLPEAKLDVETENPDKVFYEAKLVAGEGSHPKSKDLTDGIGKVSTL